MRKVYGKGINIAAQINSTRKNLKNYEIIEELNEVPIKFLNCGYLQTYYLLENGQIIKNGNLMDSVVNIRQLNLYRLLPKFFTSFQKLKFLGKTLSFRGGHQKLTTLNLDMLLKNIVPNQIQFGLTRIFFKDYNHKFQAIGQNYFGQLATKDTTTLQQTFRVLDNPINQRIMSIKCGFQHTLILTQSGNLYGCGKADSYQIQPMDFSSRKSNITVTDKILEPSLIFKGKVTHAAGGFKHTVFSTQQNQLYSLGNNKYGQCGHSIKQDPQVMKPKKIYFPLKKNQKIRDIKCGFNHSLVLTNQQLYFFGCTQQNQNPFQKFNENLASPSIVNLPFKVQKIFTNFDRTAVIGTDNECLIFGGNNFQKIGGQNGKVEDLSNQFNFSKESLIGLGFGHTILYP